MKRLLMLAALFVVMAPLADAGVVRFVVKPVVKAGAKVVATTVKTAVKVTKAVVY